MNKLLVILLSGIIFLSHIYSLGEDRILYQGARANANTINYIQNLGEGKTLTCTYFAKGANQGAYYSCIIIIRDKRVETLSEWSADEAKEMFEEIKTKYERQQARRVISPGG